MQSNADRLESVSRITVENRPEAVDKGVARLLVFRLERQGYALFLAAVVKVVQELLRHANSRITLDLYAQAGMQEKRQAQSKLVDRVLRKGKALA